MTEKPYTERLGGSYRRDKPTGKATLVERTADLPAAAPVPAAPAAEPETDAARKPAAKARSL